MSICHECGADTVTRGSLSVRTGPLVTWRGKQFHATPNERIILGVLASSNVATMDKLRDALGGAKNDTAIHQLISQLRIGLPESMRVLSVRGQGFILVEIDDAEG